MPRSHPSSLVCPLSVRHPGATIGAGRARQNPETVIRSSVRLVQVSVVVEDKKGNPVTDLKQEDFTLLDEGNLKYRFF